MSREKTNYDLLIEKLDQFIRKFYINQLIRGGLYSIGLIVLCFLFFAIAEYFFYFKPIYRKLILFSFIGISLFALVKWVAIPLVHYFRLGKIISHQKAAEIIGEHFVSVKDKLVNILQLNQQLTDPQSQSLIIASINQKSKEIEPVPFQSAIDLSKNRKYLPYALPPLLLLLGLIVGAPSLIKDPTNRILKNNQIFEREAPFHFQLDNQNLEVPQYEDFHLDVKITGDYLPQNAYVVVNGFQYKMKKLEADHYAYTFNNVQQNQKFSFESEGINSIDYELSVLKKPNILDFKTSLDYPAYLGRTDEALTNVGDLVVPEGTKIDWILQSVNTDHVSYVFGSEAPNDAQRLDADAYTFSSRVYHNTSYKLVVGNDALPNSDSISYTISVIPDQYPSISVKQFVDSMDQKLLYLVGDASDDYGLRNVTFNYQINNKDRATGDLNSVPMREPTGKTSTFDHVFDIHKLDLKPGDEVTYYFEAWDNDGINGSKSTRSSLLKFMQPTAEEFAEKEDANEEDIKNKLDQSLKESQKIKEDFRSLREKMLQEKSVDWQMKKELQDLLDRQKSLEDQIENAKEKFEENLKNQEEFDELTEETIEKQEKIQELFEELADEETKELMEKIQELMEELKKDEALQLMEDMEFNEDELSMELERLKELFKQLELERDVMQELEKLKELAKEQEALAEETEGEEEQKSALNEEQEKENAEENQAQQTDENNSQENGENDQQQDAEEQQQAGQEQEKTLEEQQEDINEAFEDIKKTLEELSEKNQELQAPKNMGEHQEQSEDIQQDLNQSLEQLQKQQNQNASKSQKNASQKMQEMAEQMQQQMQEGDMQQMAEDMQAMRQLLENLIGLSFDQESLIEDFNKTHTSTPSYTGLIQQQHKLEDDFHLIEDSLQALSQRVYQIESFVLEKVAEINNHMSKSLQLLEDRKKAQASDNQQRVMKNVNDLALMFSESMNQMQQQMAAMMSGQQMCTKPGGAKPNDGNEGMPMDKISEGQKNLNGEMQKMKEGMQEGEGEGGSSKEFAQMAAKQAALRKALRDIQNQKQGQGQGSKELEEILQQMDKIETDLVNKRLTNEMLKRQEEILTRLLESERAEREKEYDNKRESRTAENTERKLPPSIEEYLKEREAQIEPFKTVSPALKPYYKQLVEEYYKSLKEN
ncbi:MAG: DUF4175 domain-containing protein [Saprospiraceae bacterium]|nr:DUF4175 domain-containing protein [Saprospiraceae bacterium]